MSKRNGVALLLVALSLAAILTLHTRPVISQVARLELAASGGTTTAGAAFSLVVTARLAGDDVDTAYNGTVHFASSDPAATLPGDYTFNPAIDAGSHTFAAAFILCTSGSQTVTVTDNYSLTDSGTWSVAPAAASRLEVSGSAAMTAGAGNELTVTARDSYGNTAVSYSGSKQLTFSGPHVSPGGQGPTVEDVGTEGPTAVGFTSGVSNAGVVTLIAYAAEATSVDVSDGDIDSFGSTADDLDLTISPASAARIEVSGEGTVTAGSPTELSITARDPYGNMAASYTGLKALTFSGPVAAPEGQAPTVENVTVGTATPVAFTGGVCNPGAATFVAFAAGTTTVDVSDGAIDSAGSPAYDLDLAVNPAAVAGLHFVPAASSAVADNPVAFTVLARDQYGNTVTGYSGTVGFTSSDPGATLPSAYVFVPADAGTRAFAATLRTSGSQNITVTDAGNSALTAISVWSVGASAIDHYTVTPDGYTHAAGDTFQVTVTACDAFGNPVTADSSTLVTLTSSSATMLFDASGNGVFGESADNATVLTSGTLTIAARDTSAGATATITASDPAGSTGTSSALTIIAASAIDHYAIILPPPGYAAGDILVVTVTALDSFGNVVSGDSSTPVFLTSSSTTLFFDANDDQVFGEPGDDVAVLSSGTFNIACADVTAQTSVTITAMDGTARTGTSSPFDIAASGLDHYTVTCASYQQAVGASFTVTVTACDPFGNVVAADSSTAVTMTSSSAAIVFDGNANGVFGEPGDNVKALSSGAFDITAREAFPVLSSATFDPGAGQTFSGGFTITATDELLRTGTSDPFTTTADAAAIDHYTVTSDRYSQQTTVSFVVTITACDASGNLVPADNVAVTVSCSAAEMIFDGNVNGSYGEPGDSAGTLTAGTMRISAKPTSTSSGLTIAVADAAGRTGVSQTYTVKDFRCFIATAAWGTPMADQIQVLRDFRDEYLMLTPQGRVFVSIYYRCSPPIARFIGSHDWMRAVVRAALTPIVWLTRLFMVTTLLQKLLAAALVLAAAYVALRTRLRHSPPH